LPRVIFPMGFNERWQCRWSRKNRIRRL
jgi:hypothetical protein